MNFKVPSNINHSAGQVPCTLCRFVMLVCVLLEGQMVISLCSALFLPDERFPEYGKVEFVFSYGPEKIQGKASSTRKEDLHPQKYSPRAILPIGP